MNIPQEMQNSLKAGVDIKGPLPILQTSFSFEFFGFDAKTIAERLNFVSSLGNAPSMGIFIQDINITSYMGKAINIPVIDREIVSLFRNLSALQEITGIALFLPDDIVLDRNTVRSLLVNSIYLLQILETKIIPKLNASVSIKPPRNVGITIIKDYKNKLINNNAMFRTHFSQSLLGKDIVILDAQLDLGQYTPVTKLNSAMKSKGELEIVLQPTRTDHR